MMVLKEFMRDWLPPAIVRWVSLQRGGGICFEGDFTKWEQASVYCTGYDADEILAKVLNATLKVKRGEAAFERDSVNFDQIQYVWPVLTGLMWAAASNCGRLNVLDFGGALGSSYFQNRMFLKSIPELRWNVIEQEHYVKAGQAHIQDEQLRFYKTIEDCLSENQISVVLLSSVLQYLPDPYELLKQIYNIQAKTIILDRTCYLNHGEIEIIKIQHVPSSIYTADYPCRFFIEDKLCDVFNTNGYQTIAAFDSLDKLSSIASWKGHIFQLTKKKYDN